MLAVLFSALIIQHAFANVEYITHGAQVALQSTKLNTSSGLIYNFASSFWNIYYKDYDGETEYNEDYDQEQMILPVFKIYKDPYYKSPNNTIITGKSIKLVAILNDVQVNCSINSKSGVMICKNNLGKSIAKYESRIRILDKKGGGNMNLMNGHYIKFRLIDSNVDCNGNEKAPLQCRKKTNKTGEYGFVIYLV